MLFPQDSLAAPTVPPGGPGGPLGLGEGAAAAKPTVSITKLRRESFMLVEVEDGVGNFVSEGLCD